MEKTAQAVNSIYSYMTNGYLQIWSSIFVSGICLIMMIKINIWLSVLMILNMPIVYFGFRILNKNLMERSKKMQMDTSSGFEEILSRIKHVDYFKQLSNYDLLLNDLNSSVEKVYGSMASVNVYAQSMTVALQGVTEVIKNILMLFLIYNFSINKIDSYSLMLSTLIIPLYFSNITTIVNSNISKKDFNIAKSFQNELFYRTERDGTKHLSSIDEIYLSVNELDISEHNISFHATANLKKVILQKYVVQVVLERVLLQGDS
jgi:ABC-type multidrug transport system fused ATPase/permease subunit